MKIAIIVSQFPIISEVFILNLVVGLLDRGHDVHIHSLDVPPSNLDNLHPIIKEYDLLNRVYYPYPMPKNKLLRVLNLGRLILSNIQLGAWKCLRLLDLSQLGYSVLLGYKAIALLQSDTYDIVHSQFGYAALHCMTLHRLGFLKGKFIATFRGYDITGFICSHNQFVYRSLFAYGDYFLSNCNFFRKRVISLGCAADKIGVIGSGIDVEKFSYRLPGSTLPQRLKIVTVGRLVEKKGIEYAIRAVKDLTETIQHIQIEYLIVGGGPLRESLNQLIQRLNLDTSVRLVGSKSQTELISILKEAHLFVAPSVTAKSGDQDAPVNTLKEAMAIGIPVISTRHGGIPELIDDGFSGFLVPERDADAIANKLEYLIQHPEVWQPMSQAARQRVELMYDINKVSDDLVGIYQQVLERKILVEV